jgi:hypothetical protein
MEGVQRAFREMEAAWALYLWEIRRFRERKNQPSFFWILFSSIEKSIGFLLK